MWLLILERGDGRRSPNVEDNEYSLHYSLKSARRKADQFIEELQKDTPEEDRQGIVQGEMPEKEDDPSSNPITTDEMNWIHFFKLDPE